MYFTGATYRYFTDTKELSFVFQNLYVNALDQVGQTPQSVQIGFTGITGNADWHFNFSGGKIYDPDNRFFGSYNSGESITLSGNINNTNYGYYLNDEFICSLGQRANKSINGWYIKCNNGANVDGNVYIYGPRIPCYLTYNTTFPISGNWDCSFFHEHYGPIVIRSGKVSDETPQFVISGTGLSFNNGTNVLYSGQTRNFSLTHSDVYYRTGFYIADLSIYTDFGKVDFELNGYSTSQYSDIVVNSFITQTGYDFVGTGNINYWYFSTTRYDPSGTPLTKPAYTTLYYTSGYTGTVYRITGYNITTSGEGYESMPLVYVDPTGSGYPIASGWGLTGGSLTGVTGIFWTQSGAYTTTPTTDLVFSGGGAFSTEAEGTCLYTTHLKTFTGIVNLCTGIYGFTGNTVLSSTSTAYTGLTTLTTGETLLALKVTYVATPDTIPLRYVIMASGLTDTFSGTSIYYDSGLIYNTSAYLSAAYSSGALGILGEGGETILGEGGEPILEE